MDKCKYCQYFKKDCVIDYEQSTPNKIIWTEYEKCLKCSYRKSETGEHHEAENQEARTGEAPNYLKIDWSKNKTRTR